MAVLNYADQFKYTGKGYIDSKLEPKKDLSELNKINVKTKTTKKRGTRSFFISM